MRVEDCCMNYACILKYFVECGILNRSESIFKSLWKLKTLLESNDNKWSQINDYFCLHNNYFYRVDEMIINL